MAWAWVALAHLLLGCLLALPWRGKPSTKHPDTPQSDAPSPLNLRGWLKSSAASGDFLASLQQHLLSADLGPAAVQQVLQRARHATTPRACLAAVKEVLRELLPDAAPELAKGTSTQVVMFVGVNGVGKTTSIAKLAQWLLERGHSVALAAADTFRAAAVEQLEIWGQRHGVEVFKGAPNADPASVAHNALTSARAKGDDFLLVDTAGRLHNRDNLMNELGKIRRVLAKVDAEAPQHTLLVLDAHTGHNALRQAEEFDRLLGVSGIVVSKLDGSARAGMLFSLGASTSAPIHCLGVGARSSCRAA